jgi:hypothetical protein
MSERLLTIADLHVHSNNSWDGKNESNKIFDVAGQKGVDVLAITDHDGIVPVPMAIVPSGLTVLPGVEISTKNGHCLVISPPVEEMSSFLAKNHACVNNPVELDRVVEFVAKYGGAIVVPHPAHINGMPYRLINRYIEVIAGAEGDNGEYRRQTSLAFYQLWKWIIYPKLARLGIAILGNSDAHRARDVGGYANKITAPLSEGCWEPRRIGETIRSFRYNNEIVYLARSSSSRAAVAYA